MSEQESTLDDFTAHNEDKSSNKEKDNIREEGFLTLPRGWNISPVSEVAKEGGLVDGDWIESADMDDNGEIQLVQLGHLGEGQFKGEPNRFITNEFAEKENCTLLSEGDLLISRMQEPILRSCLLPSFDRDSIMAVDIARLQHTEDWNRHFLKYLFNSRPIWKQGIAWASGTTRKRISRKNIEKLRLPTPPLSEQRKIATVLYTIDQAIEKTEEVIEQVARLKKGVAQDLFHNGLNDGETKDTWLGVIPEKWEVVRFGDIIESSRNGIYKPEEAYGGETPILKMGDMFDKMIFNGGDMERLEIDDDEIKKYRLNQGDLLFARRSLNVEGAGDCTLIGDLDETTVFESSLIRVCLQSGYEPMFYAQYFEGPIGSKSIERIVTTTTASGIAGSDLKNLLVPKPQKHIQEKIGEKLQSYDIKIGTLEQEREKLKKVKKGLMQDLLSGTVRTDDTNIQVPDEVAQHG